MITRRVKEYHHTRWHKIHLKNDIKKRKPVFYISNLGKDIIIGLVIRMEHGSCQFMPQSIVQLETKMTMDALKAHFGNNSIEWFYFYPITKVLRKRNRALMRAGIGPNFLIAVVNILDETKYTYQVEIEKILKQGAQSGRRNMSKTEVGKSDIVYRVIKEDS